MSNFEEMKFRMSRFWYLVGLLLIFNIGVLAVSGRSEATDHVKVWVFDVGQGDSIYIRSPEGNDVVIDGGPGERVLAKLGEVMPPTDREIELMVLTHPHADHVSGLVEVLKRFKVKKVLVSEVPYGSATYNEFLRLLDEKNIEISRPKTGQTILLDRTVSLDVLYPLSGVFENEPSDPNEVSTVMRLNFGMQHMLFTGDAGLPTENWLVASGLPLGATVLKVGHQGSKTSSGQKFLEVVNPKYAAISVGENNYGHPHEQVLGALAESGAEVVRTDENGDIFIEIHPDRVVLPEPK